MEPDSCRFGYGFGIQSLSEIGRNQELSLRLQQAGKQNRTEILWKQPKYFWRRFLYLGGEEIRSIMENDGKTFTINYA